MKIPLTEQQELSNMNSQIRRWVFVFAIIAAVLVVDQVTKYLVVTNLRVGESDRLIPALYPYFQITRSQNTGSAFGFLPQAGDAFLVIELVISAIMLVYYPRVPDKARLIRLGIGLVIGGALGNAADRLTRGAGVDFIHYQIPGIISNVSNPADHAIVIGVLLIVAQTWRADENDGDKNDEDTASSPENHS